MHLNTCRAQWRAQVRGKPGEAFELFRRISVYTVFFLILYRIRTATVCTVLCSVYRTTANRVSGILASSDSRSLKEVNSPGFRMGSHAGLVRRRDTLEHTDTNRDNHHLLKSRGVRGTKHQSRATQEGRGRARFRDAQSRPSASSGRGESRGAFSGSWIDGTARGLTSNAV